MNRISALSNVFVLCRSFDLTVFSPCVFSHFLSTVDYSMLALDIFNSESMNSSKAARQQSCDQRTWLSVSKGLMTLGRAHWSMTIQSPAMAASTCGQSHTAATHTGQNTLNQRSNDANEKRFCALTFSWQENSNSVHVVYCALQTKQGSLFCIRTRWTKSACCLFNSHIYGFLLPSSVHRKNNSPLFMLCPNWTVYTNCKYIHI